MAAVKRKQEKSAAKVNFKKLKAESRSAAAGKKAVAAVAPPPPPPRVTVVEDEEGGESDDELGGDDGDGGEDDGEDDGEDEDGDGDMPMKDSATAAVAAPTAKTAEEGMFRFSDPYNPALAPPER